MIKKLAVAFLSANLLGSVAFADQDKVVATYNNETVKESEIMQQFKPMLDMQPETKDKKFIELDGNVQENLVMGYIRSKLIENEAKKIGVESSKEFQDKINNIKAQLLQQEVIERQVKSKVTDKMIDEEYKKLIDGLKGQHEVKVSHILVTDKKTADSIKKKLNQGKSFADLAKEYSTDEASKIAGGEIGYIMKGQLVPEFEDKALAMKIGEVSNPVQTQFGWHLIKVLDKRDVTIPNKEQAIPGIKNKLSREAALNYVTELEKAANVKLSLPKKEEPKDEKAKK